MYKKAAEYYGDIIKQFIKKWKDNYKIEDKVLKLKKENDRTIKGTKYTAANATWLIFSKKDK